MGKKNKKSNKSNTTTSTSSNNSNISTSTTSPTANTTAHQSQKQAPLGSQSATEQHHHRSHSHSHHTHTRSGDQHQDSQQNDDDQVEQEEQQKGFKGQAKKDMRNVEGYVADREGYVIDETKLQKAMTFVNEESQKLKAQKLKKQKETEKITVSKEDIEFIIKEMEVTKPVADKYLREHKGNLVEALKAIINAY